MRSDRRAGDHGAESVFFAFPVRLGFFLVVARLGFLVRFGRFFLVGRRFPAFAFDFDLRFDLDRESVGLEFALELAFVADLDLEFVRIHFDFDLDVDGDFVVHTLASPGTPKVVSRVFGSRTRPLLSVRKTFLGRPKKRGMTDPVRVTLEDDDDATSVRVYDDEGDVSTDGATFRFSVDGDGSGGDNAGAEPAGTDPDREPRYVAPLSAVPTDGTLRCEARRDRRGTELILRRRGDDVLAWRNSCPHKPEVRLDPGPGAIVRDDQLVCHEHAARFDCADGVCTAGPCRGDALEEIAVAVRDGDVYLTDDRFDSCRRLDEPRA